MSIKDDGYGISSSEQSFILQALKDGRRCDGRQLNDIRKIGVTFTRNEKQCTAEVQLGRSRVLAVVTAEVVPPWPDRKTEGFLNFNTELSPMASPAFEAGRPSVEAVELGRIVERGIRDSNALDTEALCIIAGEKVWSVKVNIHCLDHGGNLIDAAALAAIAALKHCRLPQVTIVGENATIHTIDEREPVPLSVHHIPVCVTFALFNQGELSVIDPTEREELVMEGRISFTMNAHRELCAVHKIGGIPITQERIMQCASAASMKAQNMCQILATELAKADGAAKAERLAYLRGLNYASAASANPFSVQTGAPESEVDYEFEAADYKTLHTSIELRQDDAEMEAEQVEKQADLLAAMQNSADASEASTPAGFDQDAQDELAGLVQQRKIQSSSNQAQKKAKPPAAPGAAKAKAKAAVAAASAGADDDLAAAVKKPKKKNKKK